jgi:hypothetical protein
MRTAEATRDRSCRSRRGRQTSQAIDARAHPGRPAIRRGCPARSTAFDSVQLRSQHPDVSCGRVLERLQAGTLTGMVFVADDLGAWLIGALADAGRKKLTTIVVGTDQERALRSAATAAVRRTAGELHPDDAERAETLARLVNRALIKALVPGAPIAGVCDPVGALQAGIAGRLAVVDDTGPAAPGQAPGAVREVPGRRWPSGRPLTCCGRSWPAVPAGVAVPVGFPAER